MTIQPYDGKKVEKQARKAQKQAAKAQRLAELRREYRIQYDSREVWVMLGSKRVQGGSIWGVRCTVQAGGNVHSSPSAAGIMLFGPLGFGIRNVHDNRHVVLVFEGPAFTFTYSDRGDPTRAYGFAAEFNRRARAFDGLPR